MSTATRDTRSARQTAPRHRALRAVPRHESWAGAPAQGTSARQLEELWDRHGDAIYSLATMLVDDEATARRVVTLAMIDLALTTDCISGPDAQRSLARHVYLRSQELTGAATRTQDLPPAMVWLAELAPLQRACVALCCFGDHTYRQAAALLRVPAETAAELLTAGLRDVAGFVPEPASCA